MSESCKIAYSYVRFSSPQQRQGDSLRRQMDASAKYVNENGLTLDTTLTLHDLATSAFRGKHATVGALGVFVEAVRSGRVRSGSTLIVEALDRMSREEPVDAQTRFLELVRMGITIVTLIDRQVYDRDTIRKNPFMLFVSLAHMISAHEQSKSKSIRVSEAWQQKQKNAATKKLTRMCPGWLRLRDDRTGFDFVPEHVATIRRIVQMATQGMGYLAILRVLNREKVPTWARRKKVGGGWDSTTVNYLMRSRTLIGEYHPQLRAKNKVDRGPAIPNYYPAVITEPQWYAMQAVIATRKRNVKGRSGSGPNLFGRLLKDADSGSHMRIERRTDGSVAMTGTTLTGSVPTQTLDSVLTAGNQSPQSITVGGVTSSGPVNVGGVYGAGNVYTHLTDAKLTCDLGTFTIDANQYCNFTGAISTGYVLLRGNTGASAKFTSATNGTAVPHVIITKDTGGRADDCVNALQVDGSLYATGATINGDTTVNGNLLAGGHYVLCGGLYIDSGLIAAQGGFFGRAYAPTTIGNFDSKPIIIGSTGSQTTGLTGNNIDMVWPTSFRGNVSLAAGTTLVALGTTAELETVYAVTTETSNLIVQGGISIGGYGANIQGNGNGGFNFNDSSGNVYAFQSGCLLVNGTEVACGPQTGGGGGYSYGGQYGYQE